MSGAPTQVSLMLASLFATSPLILALLASVFVCWQQRDRRPKTARLLGWTSFAYLLWSLVGVRVFRLLIHLAGLDQGPSPSSDDMDWILKAVAVALIPATVQAVIWGCALWSILMIDEYRNAPQTNR